MSGSYRCQVCAECSRTGSIGSSIQACTHNRLRSAFERKPDSGRGGGWLPLVTPSGRWVTWYRWNPSLAVVPVDLCQRHLILCCSLMFTRTLRRLRSPCATRRITMHQRKRLSIKSVTAAGIAASVLLGFAAVALNPAPAQAVVYCQYVDYPPSCVARAGVVLRPRPVARAAVRHNAGGNLNGGVNRVGVRR